MTWRKMKSELKVSWALPRLGPLGSLWGAYRPHFSCLWCTATFTTVVPSKGLRGKSAICLEMASVVMPPHPCDGWATLLARMEEALSRVQGASIWPSCDEKNSISTQRAIWMGTWNLDTLPPSGNQRTGCLWLSGQNITLRLIAESQPFLFNWCVTYDPQQSLSILGCLF